MFVTVEKQKGFAKVVLNRPDVHNAFNPAMIGEITQVFRSIGGDKGVRAVVLSGNGKSFCAGADLQYMRSIAGFSHEENQKDARTLFEMFESVFDCPVPVIGHIHGNVMGGGLGLTAACDIVAAEKDARFCFSEVKIGIIPAVISAFVLKKVPEHLARETMITGEIFGCDKAERMGLIHFAGESEEAADFVQGKIDFIKAAGPEAVRSVKTLLKSWRSHSWDQFKNETARMIADRRASPEGQEGLKAFLEKRAPAWKTD
ncbi:MAG TPA: enoyl-CoA hydratase-related protein [Bdellovibrionales bacterium]|nr:enoyl-CoA hydratase-related protein [Bdellovibrionales bacterium]